MSGEKIQLRLKSDPRVVLPEAVLEDETDSRYLVSFPGASSTNYFPKHDWEPVPPPYVLPTGIGAVIECRVLGIGEQYVRVLSDSWRSAQTGREYHDADFTNPDIRTISEGVEL